MKCCLIAVLLICSSFSILADDVPCTAIPLSNSMTDFMTYNNAGNTDSGIGDPSCGNYTGGDMWFSFTAPPSGMMFIATVEGIMIDGALALYEGPCNNLTFITCIENDLCGNTEMPIYKFVDLTPGQTYFIRIWSESGTPQGTFDIFLNEDPIIVPEFITIGSANYIDEVCILLTPESQGLSGCAWFPVAVDFTQEFEHNMTVNFGDIDGNGADGITLAYQSGGTNFCGGTGENIGAGGMPNSFIVEFDTWQNGNLNDPPEDHTAVQINGNMNHNSSINGPFVLGSGNVEDGLDHTIRFTWDPLPMFYEVYFDDVLYMSGVYDIISNCFGGSSMAYWGYTASTGGSVNNHVICPEVETFDYGELSNDYVEICDGDSYFVGGAWQTEPGFYYDQIPLANGCYELIQTELVVNPVYETDLGDFWICNGDVITIEGLDLTSPGDYSIPYQTVDNCDSIVVFHLNVIFSAANAQVTDSISCNNPVVFLTSFGSFPPINNFVTYIWTGPNGFMSNEANASTTEPGTYYLQIEVVNDFITCYSELDSVEVIADLTPPIADAGPSITLDCNNDEGLLDGSESTQGSNITYLWTGPNGYSSTSIFPTVSEGGQYDLQVTAGNGCSASSATMVMMDTMVIPPGLISSDTLDCSTTSVQLSNTNHIDGMIYNWGSLLDPPVDTTLNVISAFDEGTYAVTITDLNGCSIIDSVEVLSDSLSLEFDLQGPILSCSDPIITVVSNVIGPVSSVNWSGPNNFDSDELDIEIQSPGLYLFTVTDSLGCIQNDSILILQDTLSPTFNFSIDSISCLEAGVINIDPDGSYIYNWTGPGSFQSTDEDIMSSLSGVYQLTVTGSNGCITQQNISLPAGEDFPSYFLDYSQLNCTLTETYIILSSPENISNISWTLPDGTDINDDSLFIEDGGNYTFTFLSENGCEVLDSVMIVQDTAAPQVIIPLDTLSCDHPVLSLIPSLPSTMASFSWVLPDGQVISADSLVISEGGNYILNSLAANGCTDSDSINIPEFFNAPIISLSSTDIDCKDSLALLTIVSQENLEVQWTLPDLSEVDSSMFSSSLDGTFFYTAVNNYGCDTSGSVLVQIDTILPTANIQMETLNCINSEIPVYFDSSDPIIGQGWSGPNLNSSADTITLNTAGPFFLELTSANNCTSLIEFEIPIDTIPPDLDLDQSGDIDCLNPTSVLTALSSGQVTWFDGSGNLLGTENSISVDQAGFYTSQAVGSNGCQSSGNIEVSIDTLSPDLNVSYNDINCLEPIGNMTVDNPSADLTYDWYIENNLINQGASFQTTAGGNVEVIATASNGCVSVELISIQIDTISPDFDLEVIQINCFNTAGIAWISNAQGQYSYEWLDQSQVIETMDNVSDLQAGMYDISALNPSNGCTSVQNFVIDQYVPVTFDLDLVQPDCDNPFGSLLIDDLTGGLGIYIVSIDNGQTWSENLEYTGLLSGSSTAIVEDLEGCAFSIDYEIVEILPVEVSLVEVIQANLGDQIQLEPTLNINISGIESISWSPSENLSCSDCLNPQVLNLVDEIYTVVVTDSNGCMDEAMVRIIVDERPNIYLPNIFSPHNKDGINDFFYVFAKPEQVDQINHFSIFDRWGERVYSAQNIPPNDPDFGWNGTFKGSQLQPAVFTYLVQLTLINGEVVNIYGDVTLID